MMHMVINNAWQGDPYKIDTLFMYMANMAWNSAMNTAETMRMLTDKDPATGEYKIPRIIYSDALLFRDGRLCRSDPARHDLSRALGLHLAPRPADRRGRRPGRLDPPADPRARPRRAAVSGRADRSGRAARLPAFATAEGGAALPGRLQGLHRQSRARAGHRPARRLARRDGDQPGKGAPNPNQLERYIANGCFWKYELPEEQLYYKHANHAYLENAVAMGLIGTADPIVLQLYVEPLQNFRLAAQGHGAVVPPATHRARIETYFDPLPFWYPPFEDARIDRAAFPLHAVTQRPMQMYHSWHSQNAWLRQILGHNRLFMNRVTGHALGLEDDDWVWVTSHAGRIRAQIKLMDGVNPNTVWTWNAIGKRAGAWNLAADSPEFRRGFLLNHLIAELLPAGGGYRGRQCRPDHRPGGLVRSAGAGREGAARGSRHERAAFPDAGASRRRCGRRPRSCATAPGERQGRAP